jgi:hypothetical protein
MHTRTWVVICFLTLIIAPRTVSAEEPPADDPTAVDARPAAEAFEIPATRTDFPIKAGMTVAQIDAFVESQRSLANERDLEKIYNFGWHKRDIENGNGWMYYWVNGKGLLHCDIVIRDGKARSVWAMPGNSEWNAMIHFRLSGAGPHDVDTSTDPSRIESDKQLAAVDRPLRLDRLWLHGPEFTDRGMGELRRFRNVEIVSFNFPSISGASLKELQSLKKLRKLDLGSVICTNDDLRHISSITTLENVSLMGNKAITDDGLEHLARLPLRSLNLDGTSITSQGVKQLAKFRELTELSLSNCRALDDQAAEALSSMMQLKELNILFSGISKDGCADLRAKLPKCRIVDGSKRSE